MISAQKGNNEVALAGWGGWRGIAYYYTKDYGNGNLLNDRNTKPRRAPVYGPGFSLTGTFTFGSGATFQELIESRRNRREEWFHTQAGHIEI